MKTRNYFGLALTLSLTICAALMSASAVNAQSLGGGAYQVQVRNSGSVHPSVWRLQVSGNQITGTSEWDCCPATRVDPMRGYIQGNQVVIQRDCRGQGINGECQQVYYGAIGNGVIQGYFTGRGAARGNVWTLYLGQTSGGNSSLAGTWKYTASCAAAYHAGTWNGVMYFNLGADGKFSGKANGQWVNANFADVGESVLQGNEVAFNFAPGGWVSYYRWQGRFVNDASGVRIVGTATHYSNTCSFTMTR